MYLNPVKNQQAVPKVAAPSQVYFPDLLPEAVQSRGPCPPARALISGESTEVTHSIPLGPLSGPRGISALLGDLS